MDLKDLANTNQNEKPKVKQTRKKAPGKKELSASILNGNYTVAMIANDLGRTWAVINRAVPKYPDCIKLMHEARIEVNDKAITCLANAIDTGDTKVAMWWLSKLDNKTFGDKLTVDGDLPVTINFNATPNTVDNIKKLLDN